MPDCPECESDDVELYDEHLNTKTYRCLDCGHEWDVDIAEDEEE